MLTFLRKLLRPVPAAMIAVLFAGSVYATSVAQITTPVPAADVQGFLNTLIGSMNTAFGFNTTASCTGTTTSTCQGNRVFVSITGLTTAAVGVSSAAMVVTDASVTLVSTVVCAVEGYGGTGVPIDTIITPAAGTFSFTITNVAGSGALSATVVSHCVVFN